ncbi:MAG: septum formation protein Maf [Clostridia bacterium]|nr:septum formation protein Maf [Clostridia bacterium]
MTRVLLCSASPRRRELLAEILPKFEVCKTDKEERSRYLRPHLRVMDLALAKQEGISSAEDTLVISSDTLVYRRGKYYGKPETEEKACEMLRELSGVRHSVYTGVAIKWGKKSRVFYDKADVIFKKLTEEDILRYVKGYSPLDKAGAYGVQDGVVVERYEGSFSCIMGLPVEKLRQALSEMGVENV